MKKIKFGILIFLSVILLMEITLRLIAYNQLRKHKAINYTKDIDLGYTYTPGSEDYFINAAFKNKYKINSSGFNWDEFKVKKSPGIFRVLLLGSSNDSGIYSDGSNSYARLLQRKFQENGDKIEIMNFSVDGMYRTIRELNFAYKCAVKYNPDLILINAHMPIVDVPKFMITYKGVKIVSQNYDEPLKDTQCFIDNVIDNPPLISYIYDISYMFRSVCKFCRDRPGHPVTKFFEKSILKNKRIIRIISGRNIMNGRIEESLIKKYDERESLDIYLKTADSLAKLKTKLVLFNKYFSHNNSIKLKPYFKNYLGLNLEYNPEHNYGKLDGHFSQKGHKAIAKLFYEKFFTEKLIPQNYFSNKTKDQMKLLLEKKTTKDYRNW